MRLSSRNDIEAPIDAVFAALTDFDQWERAAMRRGADVSRTDTLRQPGAGMTWLARFRFRAKDRSATVRLALVEAPARIEVAIMSALVDIGATMDLVRLSTARTRLQVHLDLKPKTLAARLYIQSLKLARGRVERNFQARADQLVLALGDRIGRD